MTNYIRKMSGKQYMKRLAENPTVIIPTGACEIYGPQLPMGSDLIAAKRIAELVAEKTGALIAPTIEAGESSALASFPCTFAMPRKILEDWLDWLVDWWRFTNANGSDIFQYSGQMAHGHASECGTSVFMYLFPELVDMDELSRVEPLPASEFPDFIGFQRFTEKTPNGTIGDATVATKEKGEKIVTRCVDRIVSYMEKKF